MKIQEIVQVGRAGARRAQIEGSTFELDDQRLIDLGAKPGQIEAAKRFLRRYAKLDEEVRRADGHMREPRR